METYNQGHSLQDCGHQLENTSDKARKNHGNFVTINTESYEEGILAVTEELSESQVA